jgi:hypothetical protein
MTKITVTKKQLKKIEKARKEWRALQKKQDKITDALIKDLGFEVDSLDGEIIWDAIANGSEWMLVVQE